MGEKAAPISEMETQANNLMLTVVDLSLVEMRNRKLCHLSTQNSFHHTSRLETPKTKLIKYLVSSHAEHKLPAIQSYGSYGSSVPCESHGISNHRPLNRLFNGLFRLTKERTSMLHITGPRWPLDSPHKGPVMWKVFPCRDVIMDIVLTQERQAHS